MAKCCRSAMNEASEFEVLQPPLSQETSEESIAGGGGGALTTSKSHSELEMALTHSQTS